MIRLFLGIIRCRGDVGVRSGGKEGVERKS